MTIEYTPNLTADRFHLDLTHQIHALVGAWGCGKSQAAIWDVLQYQQRHPDADVLVVRDTYSALADSCVAQWMRTFGEYGRLTGGIVPDFTWDRRVTGDNGKPITGTIKFRAAQEEWQVQKFLSVEVGMAWLEEATPGITASGLLSQGLPPGLFAGIWARVRQVKEERRLVLTASPPPSDRHWFYTIFYEGKPLTDLKTILTDRGELGIDQSGHRWEDLLKSVALWQLDRTENTGNLPPGYNESILPFLQTPDQVDRFYHGRVPKGSYSGWPVYPGWRDSVHLAPGLTADPGPLIRGWDGGLTPACVWVQIARSGGIKVLAELQGQDEGLEQFIPRVLAFGQSLFGARVYRDFADPAMKARDPNFAVSGEAMFRRFGLTFLEGQQDPWTRIQAVRSWLAPIGFMQVHPRCEGIVAGFRGAYKRGVVNGVPTEVPDKSEPETRLHSHRMNALEYVATRMSGEEVSVKVEPIAPARIDRLARFGQPYRDSLWQYRNRAKRTHRGAY